MVIKINPGCRDPISGWSRLFTEHLGARRVFENRDEALPNFLSCFCIKNGRKHPPVTRVQHYRDWILMGQITQTVIRRHAENKTLHVVLNSQSTTLPSQTNDWKVCLCVRVRDMRWSHSEARNDDKPGAYCSTKSFLHGTEWCYIAIAKHLYTWDSQCLSCNSCVFLSCHFPKFKTSHGGLQTKVTWTHESVIYWAGGLLTCHSACFGIFTVRESDTQSDCISCNPS